jgi:N-dimethylarginine dimethylaminohydrolase
MINRKVLISGAEFFSSEAPINPYYGDNIINSRAAQSEHEAIAEAFRAAGIEVVQVPPPATSQDGIYTANWGLCRGEKCVLSRLPAVRRSEEAYAEKTLTRLSKRVLRVPEGLKFSGQGDALPCGKYLLAGYGYRSDPEAQEFVAQQLGLELVQLHALAELDETGRPVINPVSGWADSLFYDIDLAIAVLSENLIAYCPAAFDTPSRARLEALPIEKITVSYDEAVSGLACNLVSTGEVVIMSGNAPALQSAVERRGFKTVTIKAPELAKGGGYVRCIALTLD